MSGLHEPNEIHLRRASFLEFAGACGRHGALDPQQREFARVAFDGEAPAPPGEALSPVSQEPMRVWAFEGPPPEDALRVVELVCGVRAGKSRLAGLFALYKALTADLRPLAAGEEAAASFVAPREDQARLTWKFARGVARSVPAIAERILVDTAERFVIASAFGQPVRFECFPAGSAGLALRGFWHVASVFTESAFFRDLDDGYVANADDAYAAVRPRLWPGDPLEGGGVLFLEGSAYQESGLFYDFWKRNHAAPHTAVVARTPTDVMRLDAFTHDLMREALEEARRLGTIEDWLREWCARFMSLGSERMYDPARIAACGPALELPPLETVEQIIEHRARVVLPGDMLVAGVDLGFARDKAALVVVRIRAGRYAVIDVIERAHVVGEVVKPTVIMTEFADRMRAWGVRWAMADIHYRDALRESLDAAGVLLADAPSDPAMAHLRARALMQEGLVSLPASALLVAQLEKVGKAPKPGGGVRVVMPRGPSGHLDAAAAYALAMFQAYGTLMPAAPKTYEEREAEERAARIRELERQVRGERTRGKRSWGRG